MKIFNKVLVITLGIFLTLGLSGSTMAVTTVNLGSAGNFVILSKTGITNTGGHTSVITGNIGSSPITAAAMDNVFCSEITGTIYGVDAAYTGSGATTCFAGNPPLANKTLVDNAILDMETAYNNAVGIPNPTAIELGSGNIGGMTLAPGLYKWSNNVIIPTNVTLLGGANDVWVFQIAGDLNIASAGSVPSGIKVLLSGGALASNVFWQVGGGTGATLGTYSTFNGTILSAKQIIMQTGAVLNGRALAQTQVTLDANTVSSYATTVPPTTTTTTTTVPPTTTTTTTTVPPTTTTTTTTVPPTTTTTTLPMTTTTTIPVVESACQWCGLACTELQSWMYCPALTPAAGYICTEVNGVCSKVFGTVPKLPNTGIGPDEKSIPWNIIMLSGIFAVSTFFYFARRKQTI